MSFALLTEVFGKRGITHSQSRVDANFAKVYDLIDGKSMPVLLVNLTDGSFLEMPHYCYMSDRSKATYATAQAEYKRRFKGWYKKS